MESLLEAGKKGALCGAENKAPSEAMQGAATAKIDNAAPNIAFVTFFMPHILPHFLVLFCVCLTCP